MLGHRDTLFLQLLDLAHVHIVDARGSEGVTFLVVATLNTTISLSIAHNLIRHMIGRVLIAGVREFLTNGL